MRKMIRIVLATTILIALAVPLLIWDRAASSKRPRNMAEAQPPPVYNNWYRFPDKDQNIIFW